MNKTQFLQANHVANNAHIPMQMFPMGPTSPTIFLGHFGVSQSTDKVACFAGRELTLHQPVKLEGIHVVPFGITPPGLPIEGKTLPSMTTRPFHLHMFARNVVDKQITSIFLLTIHGGVQWMAIPPPFNEMIVDFVAFDGDFEALSIIINGFPIEGTLVNGVVPTSVVVSPDVVVELDSDDEEETDSAENIDKIDNPIYAGQLVDQSTESVALTKLNSTLRKTVLKSGARQELAGRIEHRLNNSTWLSNSLVSIKSVAVLVGEIFSFAESYNGDSGKTAVTADEIRSKVLLLNRLSTYMTDCWSTSSGEEAIVKSESDEEVEQSPRPESSRDSVGSVIGPEAANLLCTIVVDGFDLLNFDSFLVGSTGNGLEVKAEDKMDTGGDSETKMTESERRVLFDQFTEALLRGCSAIMANNFTAVEFLDCGGVSVLGGLLQQQSQVSPPLFCLLLSVVSDAVQHHALACKFNEPLEEVLDEYGLPAQQQDVSPYQALLYVAAGLKSDSEEATHCGKALRWCALVETLNQLSLLSYSIFTDVSSAADALAACHASVNNNTMGDKAREDDGAVHAGIQTVLHTPCGVVATLYDAASSKIRDVLVAIRAVREDVVKSTGKQDGFVPLLQSLSKGKIMMSLIALASLAQVARDLSASADWAAPQAAGLVETTSAIQTVLLSLLRELLKVPHIETLFAIHSEEVQLLFNFLCPAGTSLLTCRSIDELCEAEEVNLGSGDQSHSLQSYGWSLWLTSHVFASTSSELPSRRSEGDLASAPQIAALKAWSCAMSTLTTCHVSRSVLCRVIAQFYLGDFAALLNKLSVQYSTGSSKEGKQILQSLLNIVEWCCRSTNVTVITSVGQHAATLVASLDAAKESLEFTNIDSDDEEEDEDNEVVRKKKPDKVSETVDRLLVKLQPPVSTVDKSKYSRSSIFRKLLKSFAVSTITDNEESLLFVRSVREQLDDCKTVSAAISQATAGSAIDILAKCNQFYLALQTHLTAIVRREGDNDSDGETDAETASDADKKAAKTDDILSSRPGVKDSLRYYATLASVVRAVLAVVHYAVLTTPDEVSVNSKIAAADILHADRLVTTIVDVHCTVSRLMNAVSCDSSAEASRAVLLLSVEILRLFTPPYTARAETSSLVAFLSKKAFRGRLHFFEEVCALLDDLLPTRFIAVTDGKLSDTQQTEFENQHLIDENTDTGIRSAVREKRLEAEDSQLVQWVTFMRRSLVTSRNAKGEAVYHAISKTGAVLTSSSSNASLGETTSAKPKKRRFSDVAARPVDVVTRNLSERNYSLETVILAAAMSTSDALQRHAVSLTHKYIASCKDFASSLSASLVSTFAHAVDAHVKPETEDANELVNQQSAVVTLLSFVNTIFHEDLACFALVQKGALKPIFGVLQSSDANVVLLGLQALTTLYCTLSRVASRNELNGSTSAAADDFDAFLGGAEPARDSLYFSVLLVLESVGALLVEQLPKLILKFQENLLILQQCPITLQLLSVAHNKQFQYYLSQTGSGVTLEFIAVKLWLAFEESFKLLSDSSVDPRRQKQLSKEEAAAAAAEQDRINCEGHVQFERASWALQAIVDCTFMAYTHGWVQLSTVARAMRTSQTDPKKVTRRVQRAYTMWAIGLANATGVDGGYHRSIRTVITSSALLHSLSENEAFDSRHALICFALKSLVDNMNTLAVYLVNKEKTFGGASDSGLVCFGTGAEQVNETKQKEIVGIDLQAPFSSVSSAYPDIENSLLEAWFTRFSFGERLGAAGAIASLSTIDGDFGKDIVGLSCENRQESFPVRFETTPCAAGQARKRMLHLRDEERKKKSRLMAESSAAVATSMFLPHHHLAPPQFAAGGYVPSPAHFATQPLGGFNSFPPPFAQHGPRPIGLAQGLLPQPFNPAAHALGPPPTAPFPARTRSFIPPAGSVPAQQAQHNPFQQQQQTQGSNPQQGQYQQPLFPPGQAPPRPGMFPPGGPPNGSAPSHSFPPPGGPHNFPPPLHNLGPPGRGMPPPPFQQQQQGSGGGGPYNGFPQYK